MFLAWLSPMLGTNRPDRKQKFINQIAAIPNLKIDYVVLNAGVLRYPNVNHMHVNLWSLH